MSEKDRQKYDLIVKNAKQELENKQRLYERHRETRVRERKIELTKKNNSAIRYPPPPPPPGMEPEPPRPALSALEIRKEAERQIDTEHMHDMEKTERNLTKSLDDHIRVALDGRSRAEIYLDELRENARDICDPKRPPPWDRDRERERER